VKLKDAWSEEFTAWGQRKFGNEEFVYVWADGVYFNVRLDPDDRQCVLVLLGATKSGKKVLLAVQDGFRESEQSWHELLVDLKARGMKPPKLAAGDGALGFWAAMRKAWPKTREQRCWVHKTANVLDKMPKAVQPRAKKVIHQIYLAETKAEAIKAWDTFIETFGAKYLKAVGCLKKDREELLAFLRLPSRALEAHPLDEPDRVDLRDRSASPQQDEGQRHEGGVPRHGLQARSGRRAHLAQARRHRATDRGVEGNQVQGRHPRGCVRSRLRTQHLRIARGHGLGSADIGGGEHLGARPVGTCRLTIGCRAELR
jgi:hypothetical protein